MTELILTDILWSLKRVADQVIYKEMLCSKVRNVRSKDRVLSDLGSGGYTVFEGYDPFVMCSPLCGKAIKPFIPFYFTTIPPKNLQSLLANGHLSLRKSYRNLLISKNFRAILLTGC